MSLDLQQQEELEEVKRIWHGWLKWVVLFLLILAGLYLAGTFWSNYQTKKNQEAADLLVNFQQLLEERRLAPAMNVLQKLQVDYGKTMPATIATTTLASYAFYTNKFDESYRHFEWVYQHQKNAFVRAMTLLNMAKVKMQQQQFDAALALLDEKVDKNFLFLVSDLKGDIYVAKGKQQEAKKYYDEALAHLPQASSVINQTTLNEIRAQIETKKVLRLPEL